MEREHTNPIVFIVRLWSEPREPGFIDPQWKGTLEHLATGDRRHFIDLDGLMSLIREYIVDAGLE
jgi:hypothetical protein